MFQKSFFTLIVLCLVACGDEPPADRSSRPSGSSKQVDGDIMGNFQNNNKALNEEDFCAYLGTTAGIIAYLLLDDMGCTPTMNLASLGEDICMVLLEDQLVAHGTTRVNAMVECGACLWPNILDGEEDANGMCSSACSAQASQDNYETFEDTLAVIFVYLQESGKYTCT